MITFAVLGANFIVDILYTRFDPRVRSANFPAYPRYRNGQFSTEVTMRAGQIPIDVEVTPAGQVVPMPVVAPSGVGRLTWLRNLTRNRKALLGFCIVIFFVLVAIFAPLIAPGDPTSYVSRPNLAPSSQYIFGTEGQGKDVFRQTVWGARISLTIGFATGARQPPSAS